MKLKNGLRLLFIEDKSSDISAIGISVGSGVYYENDGQVGISHLLEHLIGRSERGDDSFREHVYKNGGILEASTSVFNTFYYLTCLSTDLSGLTKIVIDGIYNPKISEKLLNDSKESIVSELAYTQNVEPYEVLRSLMWKDSSLSRPVVGTKSSTMTISISDLSDYHHKHYNPGNTSVVVVSQSLPYQLVEILENLPNRLKISVPKVNTAVKRPAFRLFQERNLSNAIVISFPTKGYVGIGEGRHYFNIAASALSDLYISELGERGMIYGESWLWNVFPENGDFIIYIDDIDHKHIVSTLKGVINIVDDWTKKPFDLDKFELIKKHKILDLKTHTSISEKITLLTRNFSSSEEVHTYEEAIRVYEKAEIKEVLESFESILLTQKPFVVVSAGVDSDGEVGEIEKFLEDYYHE